MLDPPEMRKGERRPVPAAPREHSERAKQRGFPQKARAQSPGGYPGARAAGAQGRAHWGAGCSKLGSSAEGPTLTQPPPPQMMHPHTLGPSVPPNTGAAHRPQQTVALEGKSALSHPERNSYVKNRCQRVS